MSWWGSFEVKYFFYFQLQPSRFQTHQHCSQGARRSMVCGSQPFGPGAKSVRTLRRQSLFQRDDAHSGVTWRCRKVLYLTTAAASSFQLITFAKAIFGTTGDAAGPHPVRAVSTSRILEISRRISSTGGTKSDKISIGVTLSSWLTRPS